MDTIPVSSSDVGFRWLEANFKAFLLPPLCRLTVAG